MSAVEKFLHFALIFGCTVMLLLVWSGAFTRVVDSKWANQKQRRHTSVFYVGAFLGLVALFTMWAVLFGYVTVHLRLS